LGAPKLTLCKAPSFFSPSVDLGAPNMLVAVDGAGLALNANDPGV
jgi:hypothetical protein